MVALTDADWRPGLESLAASWKRPLSAEQVGAIGRFLHELIRWNERINLTGASSPAELVSEHLPDSFALDRLTPAGVRVLDVGSGGGLPAVPFALLRPEIQVTLVEPRSRRAAFLRRAVSFAPSLSRVIADRARPGWPHGRWDLAVSRATFEPAEWLRVARDLVSAAGTVVVLSTAPPPASLPLARVRQEVTYQTGSGRPRWAGAFAAADVSC